MISTQGASWACFPLGSPNTLSRTWGARAKYAVPTHRPDVERVRKQKAGAGPDLQPGLADAVFGSDWSGSACLHLSGLCDSGHVPPPPWASVSPAPAWASCWPLVCSEEPGAGQADTEPTWLCMEQVEDHVFLSNLGSSVSSLWYVGVLSNTL